MRDSLNQVHTLENTFRRYHVDYMDQVSIVRDRVHTSSFNYASKLGGGEISIDRENAW